MKFTAKDGAYLLGIACSLGVMWGSLSTRVTANEVAVQSLAPTATQLAVLSQKVTDMDEHLKALTNELKLRREQSEVH